MHVSNKLISSRLVTYGDRSFSVAGPKLWNNLPLQIRKSSSIQSFKKELKSHLFKNFLSFGLKWSLMRNDILLLLLYKFDIYFLLLWSAMNFWYERYTSSIIIIIKKWSHDCIFRNGGHEILISFDQCSPKCGSWLSCEHFFAWTCPFLDAVSCAFHTYKCRCRQNLDSIDRIVLNNN